MTDSDKLIDLLQLIPHPEGGHYRQTWEEESDGRPSGTCIYFLLREGERSHWHRVDATEIWHFYAGMPLTLSLAAEEAGPRADHILGPDLLNGQTPQLIVPANHWQTAYARIGWALVGCTVSPGFQFSGFELAPEGFDIP